MNSHIAYLEETRSFVRDNLTQIVKECDDWKKTGKLSEGKFREAARHLNFVSSIGQYGKNTYVAGKLNVIENMMVNCLIKEHLNRAGHFGENI